MPAFWTGILGPGDYENSDIIYFIIHQTVLVQSSIGKIVGLYDQINLKMKLIMNLLWSYLDNIQPYSIYIAVYLDFRSILTTSEQVFKFQQQKMALSKFVS